MYVNKSALFVPSTDYGISKTWEEIVFITFVMDAQQLRLEDIERRIIAM